MWISEEIVFQDSDCVSSHQHATFKYHKKIFHCREKLARLTFLHWEIIKKKISWQIPVNTPSLQTRISRSDILKTLSVKKKKKHSYEKAPLKILSHNPENLNWFNLTAWFVLLFKHIFFLLITLFFWGICSSNCNYFNVLNHRLSVG